MVKALFVPVLMIFCTITVYAGGFFKIQNPIDDSGPLMASLIFWMGFSLIIIGAIVIYRWDCKRNQKNPKD